MATRHVYGGFCQRKTLPDASGCGRVIECPESLGGGEVLEQAGGRDAAY
jgi:hypothetical protein